ncbi:TPA: signal peptide peptidase SppA [Candidatus Poribacteria bacterium]|nr:signal peptide peptidase SppA [Candidatus Poribacteria bacterium]
MTRRTTIAIVLAVCAGMLLLVFLGIVVIVNPLSGIGPKVAVIEITGTITNSEPIIEQIHRYRDNPSVKSIVLRINSPGGAVVPTQEIYAELGKLKAKTGKKIVASMGNTAASGGYYIACAADEIFANPGTLTGSIGVIMQIITAEGLLKKVGVGSEIIKSGKFKDTGSPMRTMTDEERAILQETIDDVHTQFVDAVFESRQHKGLTRERIVDYADGRIFSGQQAFERNLVDELGDLQDAIKRAGELGGIKGEPRVIKHRRRKSLMEKILGVSVEGKVEELFDSRISLKYEIY